MTTDTYQEIAFKSRYGDIILRYYRDLEQDVITGLLIRKERVKDMRGYQKLWETGQLFEIERPREAGIINLFEPVSLVKTPLIVFAQKSWLSQTHWQDVLGKIAAILNNKEAWIDITDLFIAIVHEDEYVQRAWGLAVQGEVDEILTYVSVNP